jgi:hypothetical protein
LPTIQRLELLYKSTRSISRVTYHQIGDKKISNMVLTDALTLKWVPALSTLLEASRTVEGSSVNTLALLDGHLFDYPNLLICRNYHYCSDKKLQLQQQQNWSQHNSFYLPKTSGMSPIHPHQQSMTFPSCQGGPLPLCIMQKKLLSSCITNLPTKHYNTNIL